MGQVLDTVGGLMKRLKKCEENTAFAVEQATAGKDRRITELEAALADSNQRLTAADERVEMSQKVSDSLLAKYGDMERERDEARSKLKRVQAYREWLRDGFREIAKGTASAEVKADNYVQYAWDALSGPTEKELQEIIERRAVIAEAEAHLKETP